MPVRIEAVAGTFARPVLSAEDAVAHRRQWLTFHEWVKEQIKERNKK